LHCTHTVIETKAAAQCSESIYQHLWLTRCAQIIVQFPDLATELAANVHAAA
jgi:hypothetical protein